MIKSDGNGGMKFDKVDSINFGIKTLLIIATMLGIYYTTIGGIQTAQAVIQTKQAALCEKVSKNEDKILLVEDKINTIYQYVIKKDKP